MGFFMLNGQKTITLPVSTDALLYYNSSNPTADQHFPTDPFCRAEFSTNESGTITSKYRGLMKVDLSQIPANAYITSAKLYLFSPQDPLILYDVHTLGNSQTTLKRVTATWNESTVTWNNFDIATKTTTSGSISVPAATSANQDYIINMTSMVQGWYNGSYTNYGVILMDPTNLSKLFFASKDNTNPSKRPYLQVTYYETSIIGSGQNVSSTTGDIETTPVGTYFKDHRSQYIYTSAELIAS
jgi:hypothetical protein